MFEIATANELVEYIKDFTGSSNDDEIKKCIFLAELSMRNIELPALRSDPYAPENIGIVDERGSIPIPTDMNKPILFFKQGSQYITTAEATGTSGVNTITLVTQPAQNLQVGMAVTGTGIASGALITAVAGATPGSIVTLSLNNTGTVSGTVTFITPPPVGQNAQSQTGPWIVYDRIGDRDIITQSMIAQLYLQPVNVPAVIRGKFSEVGQRYKFLPYVAQGDLINMYYYKAWPLLFAPVPQNFPVAVDDYVLADDGTGRLGTSGDYQVDAILSATQLRIKVTGGSVPIVGTVTNLIDVTQGNGLIAYNAVVSDITPAGGSTLITVTYDDTVQTNPVLATWPEGYVYATLREYYIKRVA